MDIYQRLKAATAWVPFKDTVGPLYRPLIEHLKQRRGSRRLRAGGVDALLAARTALQTVDVPFWLDFGTLLGITRDGELIRHDTDVDIAVLHEHYSPRIRQAMQAFGFTLDCEYLAQDGRLAREECYVYKGVGLDIFYYHREGDRMWCHLFPQVNGTEERAVRELSMIYSGFNPFPFAGVDFPVPTNYHQRLVDTYGPEYQVPDPNFYTPNDAYNSRLLDVTAVRKTHEL